jgi:hypothetical protein
MVYETRIIWTEKDKIIKFKKNFVESQTGTWQPALKVLKISMFPRNLKLSFRRVSNVLSRMQAQVFKS